VPSLILIYCLDALRFLIGQFTEFLRACALREAAVILAQEAEQKIDQALGRSKASTWYRKAF
jgi:hypothetical protein